MNYLLDKVKIEFYVSFPEKMYLFAEKLSYELSYEDYIIAENYESCKINGWHYNMLIKKNLTDEGALFFGYQFNSYTEGGENRKRLVLEWNPNKIKIPRAIYNLFSLCRIKYNSVSSCDVALDFPGYTLDCFSVLTRKKMLYVGIPSNFTRYVSPQERHLRIKIYDKSKERREHNIDIPQTVRVEVSIKKPSFHTQFILSTGDEEYIKQIRSALGEISVFDKNALSLVYDEKYGKYDDVLCYLLANASDDVRQGAFALMKDNRKAKYKAYFKEGAYKPLDIDIMRFNEQVGKQLRECIFACTPHVLFV